MRKKTSIAVILMIMVLCMLWGCRKVPVPRPNGYFRISLPKKEYVPFSDKSSKSALPLTFEYPAYGSVSIPNDIPSGQGWFNIEFPAYKAKIYLTYRPVKNDLGDLIEQTYTMNVKNHITKADAIDENVINDPKNRIFGIFYDLKGNTASAVQFFVTDSTKNYLRGSLYFEAEPNADSLAPVINFFREDMMHLIETLRWQ
ncbi:MAG: gliding motility lipoprotein GldD [Bacteroidota bacterium]|nr:gliding motility lipoprotein GldD [Bacteroidota bacterium]